jgi:hypothetical protein
MSDRPLRVALSSGDSTRALFDGSVEFASGAVALHTERVLSDLFRAMIVDSAYDVAELGVTFLLRLLEAGDRRFVAIPVFPTRVFRHSCIWVNSASGIEQPADLDGRTIGEFGFWGQDSGVWARGILSDEYGVTLDGASWVVGGLDRPAPPFDFLPQPHPDGVPVRPAEAALGDMLADGRIDALISANMPQVARDGSPQVRRLFPDYKQREREWYRRTGLFPMMHTVVITREALQRRPSLAREVFDACTAAKDAALARYRENERVYQASTLVPWMSDLYEENQAWLPDDWWPYGVAGNTATLDAMLRHHFEQGITRHRWMVPELMLPELLDT